MSTFFTIGNVVAIGLCGIGTYILMATIHTVRKARAIRSWPVTTGRITTSDVHGKLSRVGSTYSPIHEPLIAYRYTAGDRKYTGHRISLVETNTSSRTLAESKSALYPSGAEVTVHYNPTFPQEAYLRVDGTILPTTAVMGVIGMALLGVGAMALLGIINLDI